MPAFQWVFLALDVVLIPLLIMGLVRHRLYRLCYSFPAYLCAVWAGDFLLLAWPSVFFHAGIWQTKETAYAVLKCTMALELGTLAFQAFPGATARARRLVLIVLLGILATLLSGRPSVGTDLPELVIDLQSRVANGTALLFLSLWALVLWYQIPLHRFHRAILRGLVPYLLVFTTGKRLIVSLGWGRWQLISYADASAYISMIAYWTWEAWRREEEVGVRAEILRTLQPWRDRL